jgi:uncharacterized membrane protein
MTLMCDNISTRFLALVLAGALLACQPGLHAQCERYSVDILHGLDCQILPSVAVATGISGVGEICGGFSDCNKGGYPAVWLGQEPWITLTLPPDVPGLNLVEINSRRQLAANIDYGIGANPRAAYYDFSSRTLINLGVLPGGNLSESHAINEDAVVCGYSQNDLTGPMQSFIWQRGAMSALSLPLGPNSVAYDISDSGAVCGWMGIAPYIDAHAYIWSNGHTSDLGVVLDGAIGADARAISSDGSVVCGFAIFQHPDPKIVFQRRAFIWHSGRVENLGVVAGSISSFGWGVNDSRIAVGYCEGPEANPVFIWRNGVMVELNHLIPAELNLTIFAAYAINNAGQIAGYARLDDDNGAFIANVGVRLTPFMPPAGDCDCNGQVGIHDLLNAIAQWGPAIPTTTADFDNNGTVNIYDVLTIIANWD